jgi:predicted permease
MGTRGGATARERVRAFFLRNPPLLAVVAALVAPDALAPDALHDAAEILAFAVLPVGFFIVGVTLAAEAEDGALAFPPPFTRPVGVALVLRLAVAPALMLALSAVTVDVPDAYYVEAGMPTGVNALVLGHAYGLDLRLTSAALAWTTAVAVVAATALGLLV